MLFEEGDGSRQIYVYVWQWQIKCYAQDLI